MFEAALPVIGDESRGSVVILRLRGRTDLGTTFMDVLQRYALALRDAGSKLVVVSVAERIEGQFTVAGITDAVGQENVYPGNERVGAAVRSAYDEAVCWVEEQRTASV